MMAAVVDPDGPVALVEFLDGATVVATVMSEPFQFDWTGAAPGEHALSVRVVDAGGKTAESETVRVVVNASGPVPTASLGLWLAADAGIAADEDGKVSEWLDQTSFARSLVQDDAELRPVRVPDELNGFPVLHFDGTDDLLAATAFGRGLFGENEATLFVVQKQSASSQLNTTLTWDAPSAANKVPPF